MAGAYGLLAGDREYAARHTIYIGKDGKVLFVDREVNVRTHGADVAAKLKELGIEPKS